MAKHEQVFWDNGTVLYPDCDGGLNKFIHLLKFIELHTKKSVKKFFVKVAYSTHSLPLSFSPFLPLSFILWCFHFAVYSGNHWISDSRDLPHSFLQVLFFTIIIHYVHTMYSITDRHLSSFQYLSITNNDELWKHYTEWTKPVTKDCVWPQNDI